MVNYSIPHRTKKMLYRDSTEMWLDNLDGRLRAIIRRTDQSFDWIARDAERALLKLEATIILRLEDIQYGTMA